MNLPSPIPCLICQAKVARNHYERDDCLDLIDKLAEELEDRLKDDWYWYRWVA